MKPRYFLTLVIGAACLLGGFSGIAAAAEDATMFKGFDLKGKGFDMSITPRFQYFIVNPNSVDDDKVDADNREHAKIPFYGISAAIKPHQLESTDFLINVFYGEDEVMWSERGARGKADVSRFDLELLARHQIPETDVNFFYGARWVHVEEDLAYLPGTSSGFVYDSTNSQFRDDEYDWVFGEVGIGFATPITRSGRHRLFGNIYGAAGYQSFDVDNRTVASGAALDAGAKDDSDFAASVDLNIGYAFSFKDIVMAHARYRALVITNYAGNDEWMVGHGPEIGLTIPF